MHVQAEGSAVTVRYTTRGFSKTPGSQTSSDRTPGSSFLVTEPRVRTRGCVKKKLEPGVLSQLRISKTPGSLSLRKPLQTPGSNFSCDKTPGSSFYKPRVQTSPVTKPRVQVSPTDDRAERSEAAEARARALQRAPREACIFTAIDTFYSGPAGSLGPT